MADITIRVRNRIAEAVGSPEIICGNSDYNAIFDLDAEWDAQEIKTMRVAWTDTFSGQPRHIDVPFFMGFAAIPAIADAYEIQIGIYTGNIMTTTPARIPCVRCITDDGTYHEDPEPETYAALLQLLGDITQGGVTVGDATVVLGGAAIARVGNIEEQTVTQDLSEATWEQGAIQYNDGTETTSTTRIRSDYISIPGGVLQVKISTTGTAGAQGLYDNDIFFYDDTGYLGRSGWNGDSKEAVPILGTTRYRVVIGKTNGSSITWSEITSCTATFI